MILHKRTKGESHINSISRFEIYLLVTFLLLLPNSLLGQELIIKTLVNRTRIAKNQQFSLTIEVSGRDAQSVEIPSPPNLSAFAALSGSSGTSSNFKFINGKMSVSKSATYTYFAQTEGKFEILSIMIL